MVKYIYYYFFQSLNAKWCLQKSRPVQKTEKGTVKTASREWVTDTKVAQQFSQPKAKKQQGVNKYDFSKEMMKRGRPLQKSSGKENRDMTNGVLIFLLPLFNFQ